MRHPPGRAVLLLWEYPQQIAVVKVESAEPRHLFGLFQIPVEPAPKRLRPVFPVGAALECDDGAVFTGCNIENAAYTPTNCAERTAVFKAVSEGHRTFRRIAIAAATERFTAPCGVCRQVLAEFNPELTMEVILVNSRGETRDMTLRDLLPWSFDGSYLDGFLPEEEMT